MAHVEDRWMKTGTDGRVRSARYGQGKRWLAVWIEDGRRRAAAFASKDGAKAKVAQVDVDQRAGTHVLTSNATVAEYGDAWLRAQLHHRDSTAEQLESRWRLHIRPALGHMKVNEVNRAAVQAAVVRWHGSLAPSTISVVYGYLASMMKAAVDDRLVRQSPCRGIKLPKAEPERVVPLHVAQVHAIARAISPRFRGMVLLAAGTGMRSGELRGLTVDRLHLDGAGNLTIRVDRQLVSVVPKWGPPKTRRGDRSVSVDANTAQALADHMATFPPREDGLIFYGRTGVPLARNTMQAAWQIGTKGMVVRARSGWHDLRHFHASMLISAGLSVTAVAERLGHTADECLQTYAHLWPNDEERMRDSVAQTLWAREGAGRVIEATVRELA